MLPSTERLALILFFKALKKKDRLPHMTVAKIDESLSAVENFFTMNRASNNHRKMAPMSRVEHGFISLSEKDLVNIFFFFGKVSF